MVSAGRRYRPCNLVRHEVDKEAATGCVFILFAGIIFGLGFGIGFLWIVR